MTPTCVRCDREMPDQAYACKTCADRAAAQLAELVDLVPAARDVAHGQTRRAGGGGSGKPGSRLPIDLRATSRLDGVQNAITTWLRHVAEERGAQILPAIAEGRMVPDPLVEAATALSGQLEWARHRAEIVDLLADVDVAVRVVRGIARGPAEQVYLGPCGAPAQVEVTTLGDLAAGHRAYVDGEPCEGDVYGYRNAHTGHCRTCGAQVDQAERRAWLDEQTRDRAYRASEIEDAHGVKAHTIRMWAARGLVVEHGRDGRDRPLYLLGAVLDFAAAMAKRRAENESKRLRREASQHAEMGA